MRTLTLASGIGCAVVGGVFFAFSTFAVPALARLPEAEAGRAMRSINVLALRPPFMVVLFGTAAACLVLGVLAVRNSDLLVVGGCASYLLGVVAVTVVVNVPLNDRLAYGQVVFGAYAGAWLRWNHVRTTAGLLAAVLLITRHDVPSQG
ncbi:DUF1772 domain-containing protein [Kineococcus radiotolerans]|uniref:DUF1772 domain-containing protein n=1 Tax=Kineococcus radiotolerans (strain ATCC BAA-149 / DSM 14245 / SRS30216) TaxID=266940 RepID=A6WAP7_KINRD|nr:anthrone oxygenase family protein [Kineococcus radiotolerans]ABS03886.1 conserved hypothetical protein [Kineococcus radiotolerans SRS30216 = ATCC BAA-149]